MTECHEVGIACAPFGSYRTDMFILPLVTVLMTDPAFPNAANATMIDSDNVLLLRAAGGPALVPAMASPGDFDFLIGDWTVHHRRLKRRLEGNTEWIEFTGPASARKILGGLGNFDEITINLPEGAYTGATLRLFNPSTQSWSIYWMDSRYPGSLDAPMVGRFENGRGLFFGDDTFNGKPIRVRFIWTPITPTSCRWEQAFSADGGITWETNWTMSFERAAR